MKTKLIIMFLATFIGLNELSGNVVIPDEFENNKEEIVLDLRSEVEVPILMYHHITSEAKDGLNTMTITPERFEEHIYSLISQGYTPIFLEELISYVESGEKLPEKPICITFDDGYLSNYEYAFPILKKYNAKANIAIIGVTVGATEYKDTRNKIIPHFTMEQALEMEHSGVVSIISHTFDMHQAKDFESGDKIRTTAVKLENETNEEYKRDFKEDFEKMSEIFKSLHKNIEIVAYPYGKYNELSNQLLKELGVKLTLSTMAGTNIVEKNNTECLYNLKRYTVYENT